MHYLRPPPVPFLLGGSTPALGVVSTGPAAAPSSPVLHLVMPWELHWSQQAPEGWAELHFSYLCLSVLSADISFTYQFFR